MNRKQAAYPADEPAYLDLPRASLSFDLAGLFPRLNDAGLLTIDMPVVGLPYDRIAEALNETGLDSREVDDLMTAFGDSINVKLLARMLTDRQRR